jgi:phenylalanyl-tRNA synthetase beta chain
MRISVNWLKDHIDLDISIPLLIDTLNSIGLLVDGKEEVEKDVILELETYANRPDTNGHLGVARELAAKLRKPLKEQIWPLTEVGEKTSDAVGIEIFEEDLCPRYSGIIVKGVKVGPSPDWLRKRIEAMGLHPVNNIVDITNYVLYSTAHPIHAFDLALLSGPNVIIRRAKKGEKLMTLDGVDLALTPEMLVIADAKKPVALAGVIGGMDSAVTEKTQDVFIESACFDPVSIRKTSKATGLQTDASYRFERGADVSCPPKAALMAASLMTQMGGKATQGIVDVYPIPRKNKTVILRSHRIPELLGVEVEDDFVVETLANLDFSLEVQQQGIWQVKVPHFRVDIEREADLIEEVARFYGYDKIPAQVPPYTVLDDVSDHRKPFIKKIRQLLFHYGMDEVINFSFADPEKEALFPTGLSPVGIRNPISSKASILRTTLIAGLLENVAWNLNRGALGAHLFEIGNVYCWDEDATEENFFLGMVTTGEIGKKYWQYSSVDTDFFRLKGACESFLAYLGYTPLSFKASTNPCFEPGHSLCLYYKGKRIGSLGRIRKNITDSYSLETKVWGAEFNLDVLFEKQPHPFQFETVVKFPSVIRDIAFIVGQNVVYEDIKAEITRLSLPFLDEFDLYDRFRGPSIPKGKVSLTLRFIFKNLKRTLQAEEVEPSIKKVIKTLKVKFGFELREGGKIDK